MTGQLLYDPVGYFRHFERRGAKRGVALGVFLLLAVVEAASVGAMPRPGELPGALLGILLNWLFGVLFFGVLWFYLGARAVGGRVTVDTTIRAVGYAFLWPGILSLATVALAAGAMGSGQAASLGSLALRLALGLWSLCLAAIAVKYTASLTWVRALIVLLWMPVALLTLMAIAVAAVVVLGSRGAG